ncbi:IS3 family transposase [Enterococcus faecium]
MSKNCCHSRFNNRRISQKTKGMTPCEYREHALAV